MKKINQGKNTNEPKLIFRVERKSEALAQNKPVYPEDRQQFRFTDNNLDLQTTLMAGS